MTAVGGARYAAGVRFVPIVLGALAGCGPSAAGLSPDGGEGQAADGGRRVDAVPAVPHMFVHTADTLYRIDGPTFDLEAIGTSGLDASEPLNDLAVTPDGDIFAISASRLYRLDGATGAASFVTDVDGATNVAMTFLADGSLLAADKEGGVRRIEPDSGAVSELGGYGDGYGTAGDLVAVADGTMYAVADQGPGGSHAEDNLLLTIDPATGAYETMVGAIGYGHVFGVAYAAGHVYAFTRDGDVIEIDRTTGVGALVRSHPGVRFFGAGVTPRVEVE